MSTLGRRLCILLLEPFPPRLDARHGGARATAEFALALAERHDVSLLCLRDDADPPADPAFARNGVPVVEIARPPARWLPLALGLTIGRPSWVSAWSVPAARTTLAGRIAASRPDLVQLEYHVMGQYLDVLAREAVPAVLVSYEPGAAAAWDACREAPWWRKAPLALEWLAWRHYERRLHSCVSAVVAFSEKDRRAIARLAPAAHVRTISPSIRVPDVARNAAGTDGTNILFFGSFRHPPNDEAAAQLVQRIFPLVRQEIPEATLTIAGEHPPPWLRNAARESIRVLDDVASLDPLLDECAVVAVPLRSGGGVRIKVMHALAAGKAIVASSLATEGIVGDEPPPLLVAADDRDFAAQISRLLRAPDDRVRLAKRARTWAERNLGWSRVVDRYEELYAELIPSREDALGR